MEIKLTLHRNEECVEGCETHSVDTGGSRMILVKLPIPEDMGPDEAGGFVSRQAELVKELLSADFDLVFIIVPMRSGDVCEMGVVSPSLEDLKECIRVLPVEQQQQLVREVPLCMCGEDADNAVPLPHKSWCPKEGS